MNGQTRVGLDNTSFSGRLRPVQDTPPKAARPQPPMEGGPTPVTWTTPPTEAQIQQPVDQPEPQPAVEPPPPVWAQQPAPNDPVLPPEPVAPPEEPIPAPEPQPEPGQPVENEEPDPLPVVKPEPFAAPADPRLQPSKVLRRHFSAPAAKQIIAKLDPRHYNRHQLILSGLAVFIFLLGLTVSLQTMQTNHNAIAKVLAQVGGSGTTAQNTAANAGQSASKVDAAKPDAAAFGQYTVAADLARYIEIPKLGVVARVSQVGITAKGALGTPDSPYDAAWYSASIKPGQPGVSLVDGLAATSEGKPGIFADLDQLAAGDLIQIVRGDGTVVNYRVVSIQSSNINQLSMQAALTAATPGKAGLNLVSMPDINHPKAGQSTTSVLVSAEQS